MSASQAFRHAACDRQRRRAEQDHLERQLAPRVLVPEALDRLEPVRHFLDLVERIPLHQHKRRHQQNIQIQPHLLNHCI
jgi:hypothetical protein